MEKIVFKGPETTETFYVVDTESGKFYRLGDEVTGTDVTKEIRSAAIKAVAAVNRHLI